MPHFYCFSSGASVFWEPVLRPALRVTLAGQLTSVTLVPLSGKQKGWNWVALGSLSQGVMKMQDASISHSLIQQAFPVHLLGARH